MDSNGHVGDISQDFLEVVERIQKRLSRIPRTLEASHLQQIEAAERVVDTCAAGMREGKVEPGQWQNALASYEDAWVQVAKTLGNRTN